MSDQFTNIHDELEKLPKVKIPKKVTSLYLLQFNLLKTHDPKRLHLISGKRCNAPKQNPTHECKHCHELIFLT